MKKHFLKKAFVVIAMVFSLTFLGAMPSFASCPHCANHAVKEEDAAEAGASVLVPIAEELDDGQQHALEVFPQQEERYGFEVFAEKFEPVVAASLLDDFNVAWRLIISAEGAPHLAVVAEIGHIQCLYGKLWNAHNNQNGVWVYAQQHDIYTALNHPTHMRLIRAGDEALADKIDLFFEGA